MDPVKLAFDRIKDDIFMLKDELNSLRFEINQLKQQISRLNIPTPHPASPTHIPTQIDPPASTPTHIPTHQQSPEAPISINMPLSTGNRGVPTDKPTDKQTNQQTNQQSNLSVENRITSLTNVGNDFQKATEILDSLDSIKKEIRLKFKRLTSQEMQVFSVLYALEEQKYDEITYKILSQRLNLSESSIRDYITKIIGKGIPIKKRRLNNKKIILKIPLDLQKIASLSTITKLREL